MFDFVLVSFCFCSKPYFYVFLLKFLLRCLVAEKIGGRIGVKHKWGFEFWFLNLGFKKTMPLRVLFDYYCS